MCLTDPKNDMSRACHGHFCPMAVQASPKSITSNRIYHTLHTVEMSSSINHDKEYNPDGVCAAADGIVGESTNIDSKREDREAAESEISGKIPQSKQALIASSPTAFQQLLHRRAERPPVCWRWGLREAYPWPWRAEWRLQAWEGSRRGFETGGCHLRCLAEALSL